MNISCLDTMHQMVYNPVALEIIFLDVIGFLVSGLTAQFEGPSVKYSGPLKMMLEC
jgi:hypothetical protein